MRLKKNIDLTLNFYTCECYLSELFKKRDYFKEIKKNFSYFIFQNYLKYNSV